MTHNTQVIADIQMLDNVFTSTREKSSREVGSELLKQISENKINLDNENITVPQALERIFERRDAKQSLEKYLGKSPKLDSIFTQDITNGDRIKIILQLAQAEKGLAEKDDTIFKKQCGEISRGLKTLKNLLKYRDERGTKARNAETDYNQLLPLVVLCFLKSPDNSPALISRIRELKNHEDAEREVTATALRDLISAQDGKKFYRTKPVEEIFSPIYEDAENLLKMNMQQICARRELFSYVSSNDDLSTLNNFDLDNLLLDTQAFLDLNDQNDSKKLNPLTLDLISTSRSVYEELIKIRDSKTITANNNEALKGKAKLLEKAMETLSHSRSHDHLSRCQEFRLYALSDNRNKANRTTKITEGLAEAPASLEIFKRLDDRSYDIYALKKCIKFLVRNGILSGSDGQMESKCTALLETRYMAAAGHYKKDDKRPGIMVRDDQSITNMIYDISNVPRNKEFPQFSSNLETTMNNRYSTDNPQFAATLKMVQEGWLKTAAINPTHPFYSTGVGALIKPVYIGALTGIGAGIVGGAVLFFGFGAPLGAAAAAGLTYSMYGAGIGASFSGISSAVNAVTGGKDTAASKLITWCTKWLVVGLSALSLWKDGTNSRVYKTGESVLKATTEAVEQAVEVTKSPAQKLAEGLKNLENTQVNPTAPATNAPPRVKGDKALEKFAPKEDKTTPSQTPQRNGSALDKFAPKDGASATKDDPNTPKFVERTGKSGGPKAILDKILADSKKEITFAKKVTDADLANLNGSKFKA